MKPSSLKRELLQSGNFIAPSTYLEDYTRYVAHDLKSPRIRATNAAVVSLLTQSKSIQLNPDMWDETKVNILWGEMDKTHDIPQPFERIDITRIPYGHQFPIERPELTANWIRQALNT